MSDTEKVKHLEKQVKLMKDLLRTLQLERNYNREHMLGTFTSGQMLRLYGVEARNLLEDLVDMDKKFEEDNKNG